MWAHRLSLFALWALVTAWVAYSPSEPETTLIKIALGIAGFALTGTAHLLAKEAGIEFKPVPLILLYLLTPLGPFVSIWLDRKANALLAERGADPGLLHLTRA